MAERTVDRVARMRGSLPAGGLGARGIEGAARNPACGRLQVLTLSGVRPARALAGTYGEPAKEGQSPFAIGRGNRFEAQLFANQAERLLELYREKGRLGPGKSRVVNVAEIVPGTKPADRARRREVTRELLRRKLAGDPTAPQIVIKPRVIVEVAGLPYEIEPDALVAADGELFYRPMEIKSYPDRGGKTNLADIRGACRQAAVEVIGLRQAVAGLGIDDPAELVPEEADLVLARPGSLFPTLRPMKLEGEIDSVERFLAGAGGRLEELLAQLPEGGTLDDPTVLDSVPTNYREACREHCPLAARCKREAVARGALIVIGSPAREACAAAGSVGWVLELIHGRGEAPRTLEEEDLGKRLREARVAFLEAVAHAG